MHLNQRLNILIVCLITAMFSSCGEKASPKDNPVPTSTTESVGNAVQVTTSDAPSDPNDNEVEKDAKMPYVVCFDEDVSEKEEPTLSAQEQKVIRAFFSSQEQLEDETYFGCYAYRHDINNDGKNDLVIEYGSEPSMGNVWGQYLAVFLTTNNSIKQADSISTGMKLFRSVKITSIKEDTIYMYSYDDSRQPDFPNEGKTSYRFISGKLEEGEFTKMPVSDRNP